MLVKQMKSIKHEQRKMSLVCTQQNEKSFLRKPRQDAVNHRRRYDKDVRPTTPLSLSRLSGGTRERRCVSPSDRQLWLTHSILRRHHGRQYVSSSVSELRPSHFVGTLTPTTPTNDYCGYCCSPQISLTNISHSTTRLDYSSSVPVYFISVTNVNRLSNY